MNSYTCDCAAGYTGTNCSTNIDDCGDDSCQNGGTCEVSKDNSVYNCICWNLELIGNYRSLGIFRGIKYSCDNFLQVKISFSGPSTKIYRARRRDG